MRCSVRLQHEVLSWLPLWLKCGKHMLERVHLFRYCYVLALLPSIICLGRLHIPCRYIFSLWQLCQGIDSGSVVRALDFYLGRRGSNPTIGREVFQLCFIPLLRLSCRKNILSEQQNACDNFKLHVQKLNYKCSKPYRWRFAKTPGLDTLGRNPSGWGGLQRSWFRIKRSWVNP